jgi:hypothetical protein
VDQAGGTGTLAFPPSGVTAAQVPPTP